MRSAFLSLLAISLLLTGAACQRFASHGERVCFVATQSVDPQGWSSVQSLVFDPWPIDSLIAPNERFDLAILLRYDDAFKYADISLEMETLAYDLEDRRIDTLTIPMREPAIVPRSLHGVFTVTDTIARAVRLPEGYKIAIRQIMPGADLKGVSDVGIILLRNK